MKLLLRFFGFLFAAGTILFVVGVAAAAGLLWHFSKDLPDYSQLQDYEPPVMTRVHAADGSLVAEYARERRLYIPIQAVPKLVINAFLAAEDKNFYEHGGLDFTGIARAAVNYLQNYGSSRRPQGASTITQQVAKNFLLTNELSVAAQDQGGAARAQDRAHLQQGQDPRALSERNLSRPWRLWHCRRFAHLLRQVGERADRCRRRPISRRCPRRRTIIIRSASASARSSAAIGCSTAWRRPALSRPPMPRRRSARRSTSRSKSTSAHIFAGEYFAEEVRRELYERYGEKKLYEGGLSVRTSLDPKLQVLARKTHDRWLGALRRDARLARTGDARSTSPATGASSLPK